MQYRSRILDEVLKFRLSAKGAILITGPKWCGKTTTAKQHAKSFIDMQDATNKNQYLALARISPLELLKGETPRLIDEWQIAPPLWDAVRQEVDNRGKFNQFILTGSSVPANMDEDSHSGIGRIAALQMRPMTLFESLESNGEISLTQLFDDTNYQLDQKSYAQIASI